MLAWLIANKYVVSGIAVVAVLGGLTLHLRSDWIAEGKAQAAATQTNDERKAWEQEREQLKAIVEDSNSRDEKLADALKAAQESSVRYAALASAAQAKADQFARERQQVLTGVAVVPEADLLGTIRKELAVRVPGDNSPWFTTGELRALLTDVREVPRLTGEVEALRASIAGTSSRVDGLNDQIMALSGRLEAAQVKAGAYAVYTASLEKHYATAFNALPRGRSFRQHLCGLVTFYLACKPAKITLPTPLELAKEKPQ